MTLLTDKGTRRPAWRSFYHVYCTQYCGTNHADMHAKAYVLNKAEYDKKLAAAANIFMDKR